MLGPDGRPVGVTGYAMNTPTGGPLTPTDDPLTPTVNPNNGPGGGPVGVNAPAADPAQGADGAGPVGVEPSAAPGGPLTPTGPAAAPLTPTTPPGGPNVGVNGPDVLGLSGADVGVNSLDDLFTSAESIGQGARLTIDNKRGHDYARYRWADPHPATGKKSLYVAPVEPIRTNRSLTDEQRNELANRRRRRPRRQADQT